MSHTFMLSFKIPKPDKPERNDAYKRWLRKWPCIVCKKQWSVEAAHTGPHGIGTKASDYACIALCKAHHQELHQIGPLRFQEGYFIVFTELAAMYKGVWDMLQARKAA